MDKAITIEIQPQNLVIFDQPMLQVYEILNSLPIFDVIRLGIGPFWDESHLIYWRRGEIHIIFILVFFD